MTSQDAWCSDYSKTVSSNLKMLIIFISSWEKEVKWDEDTGKEYCVCKLSL